MIYTPEQIREMLDAATPGPWGANEWYNTDEGGWAAVGPHHQVTHEEAMDGLDDEPDGISHERAKADAQIIAAAPTIIRELLTENERLRSALQPFANFACDPRTRTRPCDCHNCVARAALGDGK